MKRIGFIFFIVLLGFSTAYAQDFSAQDQKQIFLEGVVTAVGTSAPGQKRYQAIKAAELDAQSKLVGKTQGIHISNSTTSELNKLVKDTIERRIQGTLHGVRSCGEKFYSDGHAEVCQQIDLRGKGGIYDAAYPVIREYMPKA
ncbi:MAG: hypothetical protein B6245_17550 [Desulfobacteraceae bacterium 4572_88]|nr:MAG: hypothetical protein B6245_17550 [Desulfobacteraceae bacterium 4572_88]